MNFVSVVCTILTIYFLIDLFLKFFSSVIVKLRVQKALYKKRMNHKINYKYFKPVSIIIPVSNSKNIATCLKSVSELDYNQFEIILLVDAKKMEDYTDFIQEYDLMKVSRPFKKQIHTKDVKSIYEGTYKNISLTLVMKEKDTLVDDYNAGANIARFPYILTLEDHLKIDKNALKEFVRAAISEDNVVLCSGIIVKKRFTFRSINDFIKNTCFDLWNGNLFFPNNFCFFKKDVFFETKGFSFKNGDTDSVFCGRFHVYLRNCRRKYRIRYIMTASAEEITESSRKKESKKEFLLGLFRNKKLFLKPKYGLLSLFTYTYYFLFELLKPFCFLLEIGIVAYFIYKNELSIWGVGIACFSYILTSCFALWTSGNARRTILKNKEEENIRIVID